MMQLKHAAQRQKSSRLAKVAALLEKGNPLNKVCTEVETMVALILKEEKMDHDQLDWCNDERDSNTKTRDEKQDLMDSLTSKQTELMGIINNEADGLKKLIADNEADLATNQKEQANTTEDRAAANAASTRLCTFFW